MYHLFQFAHFKWSFRRLFVISGGSRGRQHTILPISRESIHTKPSNFSETTTGVLRVLNFLSAVGPRTSVRIKGELSVDTFTLIAR